MEGAPNKDPSHERGERVAYLLEKTSDMYNNLVELQTIDGIDKVKGMENNPKLGEGLMQLKKDIDELQAKLKEII